MSVYQSNSERITQLDILRGFAVLGIFWINIIIFGLPSGGYALPSYLGNAVNANVSLWAFSEIMVDGAMRGLFSCLFGASALIYLSENRLIENGVRRVEYFYRRNMFLILMGLFHGYILLWPYDVLFSYGVVGLFLFPLRRLSAKTLIIIGCLLLIMSDITFPPSAKTDDLAPAKAQTTGLSSQTQSNTANDKVTTDTIDETEQQYTKSEKYRLASVMNMEDDIKLHQSSYITIFRENVNTVIEQHSILMYTTHIFDIGSMMLIGMALLKMGILQGNRSRKFYLKLMLAGFIVGIAIRGPSVYLEIFKEFVPDDPEHPEELNFGFSRLPIMLGYIGLLMWLLKYRFFEKLLQPLAAVGKLALTNYISQTVISIIIFYGFGFGLIGYFERYQLAFLCILVWCLQIGFSIVWLRYYRIGPLEWLWRSAVYLKYQPLQKFTHVAGERVLS